MCISQFASGTMSLPRGNVIGRTFLRNSKWFLVLGESLRLVTISWSIALLVNAIAGLHFKKGAPLMKFENLVKFENENKKWVKRLVLSAIAAILFFIVVLLLVPCLDCLRRGQIPLTWMQLAYGLLSVLLAAALYVWGVGDWSRFEPPEDTPSKSSDPNPPPPPSTTQSASLAQPPAGPQPPKGGN